MSDDKPEALPPIVGDMRAPDFTGVEPDFGRQVRDAMQAHVGLDHEISRMRVKQKDLEVKIAKMAGFQIPQFRQDDDDLDVRVVDRTGKWWIAGGVTRDPTVSNRSEHDAVWIQDVDPCTPTTITKGRCFKYVRGPQSEHVLSVTRYGAFAILTYVYSEDCVRFELLEAGLEVK